MAGSRILQRERQQAKVQKRTLQAERRAHVKVPESSERGSHRGSWEMPATRAHGVTGALGEASRSRWAQGSAGWRGVWTLSVRRSIRKVQAEAVTIDRVFPCVRRGLCPSLREKNKDARYTRVEPILVSINAFNSFTYA